jgi:hypothetical protein
LEDSIMRRVLAVLVSVLVAGWPLLLPQPTSANPCGVTTAENGSIYAKAGHYINQYGDQSTTQGATAEGAVGATGYGGLALNVNAPIAKGGYAVNQPLAANVQLQAQETEAKAYGDSNGGDATGGDPSSNATNGGTSNSASTGFGGSGGSATGGSGGYPIAAALGVQVPIAKGNDGGYGSGGSGGNGGNAGNSGDLSNSPNGTSGDGGNRNDANGGTGATGTGGDGGSSDADAYQKGYATAGDANGGAGTGGNGGNGGAASQWASSDAWSLAKGGNATGGSGGDRWTKAEGSQDADANASNEGSSANATGGTASVTGTANTANGGTGGAGGSATIGNQTAGSQVKVVKDIAPVTTNVSVGGASGDPCKQIIKDSTGVLAVNGVNDIKGSVMQNAATELGNVANTNVNMSDLSKSLNFAVPYETMKQYGGTPNININPNNNQNTNIISF